MATGTVVDLREKLHKSKSSRRFNQREYGKKSGIICQPIQRGTQNHQRSIPRSKYDALDSVQKEEELKKVKTGISQHCIFSAEQCSEIEKKIDSVVEEGDKGVYKQHTVDRYENFGKNLGLL